MIAIKCGDGDRHDVGNTTRGCEWHVRVDNGIEDLLRVTHEIHLVHGEQDVPNAEQRDDASMASSLREQAFSGINEDHRQVGGGRTRRHVPGVLLVARRVGHDEAPGRCGKKPVGDVDGYALLSFGLQAIHQQRKVEARTLGAELARIGFQRPRLIIEDRARIVQ